MLTVQVANAGFLRGRDAGLYCIWKSLNSTRAPRLPNPQFQLISPLSLSLSNINNNNTAQRITMSATYIPSQNYPPNSTQSQFPFTSPPKPTRTPKTPSSSSFRSTQPQSSPPPPQYSFSKKRSRNDDDDTPPLASSPTRPIHALKRTLRHSPSVRTHELPAPSCTARLGASREP